MELPYAGGDLSFVAFRPDSTRNLARLEARLAGGGAERALAHLLEARQSLVDVALPRFKLTWDMELSRPLQAMGMGSAFGAADFSGMISGGGFAIGAVLHKAFIEVNEKGSEAAAATAVVRTKSSPVERYSFRADRPFLFLIRENRPGLILFAGRLAEPGP